MIFWSLKSVPELALLPRKQRRSVHARCLRRYFFAAPATPRSVAAYVAFILTVTIVVAAGESIRRAYGIEHSFWMTIILAFIGGIIGSFIFSRIAIPALRPFYQLFIERDETPIT
jgi:RsiW-degrading membrane proteinase PrsW (M82 family)